MTEETRLDRIERAIEANARAINALANSLQRVSAPPAPETPRAPIPAHLVSDPIDLRVSVLEDLVRDLNGLLEMDMELFRKRLGELTRLLHFNVIDLEKAKEIEGELTGSMSSEEYHTRLTEENKIHEFDRRLKAIEEKLSRLDV